ncbi:MAG TPA: antibiotic biosynthesis monooxygenase [Dongiaceae bacterium]
MTFVRAGVFKAQRDKSDELRRIYDQEVIPMIRSVGGNLGAFLLQQHDDRESFIALTAWRTKTDAEAYEHSGKAAQMVDKIRHALSGPPTLVTYDGFGFEP